MEGSVLRIETSTNRRFSDSSNMHRRAIKSTEKKYMGWDREKRSWNWNQSDLDSMHDKLLMHAIQVA